MHVATLLANPARADLDRTTVEAVRDGWGGGEVRWLSPGIAAEFDLPAAPGTLWQRWEELQARGIDLALQPAGGREKRVLVADMDSTMIGQECIDELGERAGFGPKIASITRRAMNGELDFESALTERVALMKGLPVATIAEVLADRITLTPGGPTLIATMKARGAWTALVSGGFTAFTGPVAARLGFDENRANRLEEADGRLTGRVLPPILGRQAKVDAVHEIAAARGVTPAEVLAVGDGANDLGMLQLAGTGVALHAKPSVAAQCSVRLNHADLTGLLYLQGIVARDFVEC